MTELQFQVLNATMDDAEDVEQIYLAVNRRSLQAGSIQPEYPLREIVDGLDLLLKDGYLDAPKFCNETSLPMPPDRSLLTTIGLDRLRRVSRRGELMEAC